MIDLLPLFDGERTEEPTERKLRKAREEGRQADASPVARPLAFLAGLLALRAALPGALDALRQASEAWLAAAADGAADLSEVVPIVARVALALGGAALFAGVAARAALGSTLWAPARVKVDFSRPFGFAATPALAPVNALANGAWMLVKLAAICGVAWLARPAIGPELDGSLVLDAAMKMLVWTAMAWLALGLAEHTVSRVVFHASLKMTHREVREDHRLAEGDPHLRGHLRDAIQDRMSRRATGGAQAGNGTGN